jgi:hypothetical protein
VWFEAKSVVIGMWRQQIDKFGIRKISKPNYKASALSKFMDTPQVKYQLGHNHSTHCGIQNKTNLDAGAIQFYLLVKGDH